MRNYNKIIWTFAVFITFIIINHFYLILDLRLDLERRFSSAADGYGCGDIENLFFNQQNILVGIYIQLKQISDIYSCYFFSLNSSRIFVFYFLPAIIASIIFYLMSSLYQKQSSNPIAFKTIFLILLMPAVSMSMGEHFKSNIGMIFILLALLINGQKKRIIFYLFSIISHVTSIFTILAYRTMNLQSAFYRYLFIFAFGLLSIISNYLYAIIYLDELFIFDFQTTLVIIYGLILSVKLTPDLSQIKVDLTPLFLLVILGSILGGGRYIISALPLLLFQASLINRSIWISLLIFGLLSLIPLLISL